MFTNPDSSNTRLPLQKPAFSFSTNSRASNLLPAAPGMQQQEQQMDGSWDMGDDVSDATHNDNNDSRVYEQDDMMTFDSAHPGNSNTHPEIDAFAVRLDSSRLLQPDDDPNSVEAALSGFDLIDRFQEVSTARLEEIRKYISEDSPVEDQEELAQWQLEHQTWELFGTLSSHRNDGDVKPQEMPKDLAYTSNVRFKEFLLETDGKFREWSLILQWLQKYAPSPTDELEEEPSRYGSGWMYTKESLKSQKRMGGKRLPSLTAGSNLFFADKMEKKNLITELDPDAPSRQQKQLEAEDEEAERNFMRLIWKFIRKGDVQGAHLACVDFGELWRAASLSGGEEAWDPSIDGPRFDIDDDENDLRVKGNRRRELWRRMCYAIARKPGGDIWEKAVYGALCGDVVSVQDVSATWEDNLYAHINSLVEEYYSKYLASFGRVPASAENFPIFNSTVFHSKSSSLSDDSTILPRIIDSLAAAEVLQPESGQALRIIQGALISDRIEDLVGELHRQIKLLKEDRKANISDGIYRIEVTNSQTLRVVVHIILVLQYLKSAFTDDSPQLEQAESLIAAYIEFLFSEGKTKLIPLYAGRLTSDKAIEVMGGILMNVKDETRLELLKLMRMYNIDVEGCLKKTMDLCLEVTEERHTKNSRCMIRLEGLKGDTGLHNPIEEEDELLIRGLEWLMLGGDALKSEVVKKGVVVYKRFFVTGRLSAAKVVYDKINSESIINSPEYTGHTTTLALEFKRIFKEKEDRWALDVYNEFEIFMRALLALESWNERLSKRPERSDRAWRAILDETFKNVHTKVPGVIKTWLDTAIEEAPRSLDTAFLISIRNIYIPELTFAMHDVYVEAGKWLSKQLLANCLELATIVADPDRSVLACFQENGRLEEYVGALADASRSVLGTGATKGSLTIWRVR
ncbi:uncharacterized protein LAJ45_05127 [Morchella importuna]|nr:uncharacterized protein LAJ45_05127 [Morchella importuna]KAH8150944.1 hypothetical protein LAJ45_05127 [Morchella importuna]